MEKLKSSSISGGNVQLLWKTVWQWWDSLVKILGVHLYEISGIDKFIETENKLQGAESDRTNEELLFMVAEFLFE